MDNLELVNANIGQKVDVHRDNADGSAFSIRGVLAQLTGKIYQVKCIGNNGFALVTFLGANVLSSKQGENRIEIFLK